MPGLAPDNLRLDQQPANDAVRSPISVEVSNAPEDALKFDDNGAVLKIEHGDGSVTVSLDGRPLVPAPSTKPVDWFSDLSDTISTADLSTIATDLLRGIADDIASRREWIEARATGLQLLGLQIEVPGLQGASDGAPVEGMSKIRHPLLLEAVLRFQANSRSELLPTDGPVKVRNDSNGSTTASDSLADALQQDLNHFLTAVATEYYPDTDRMLFMYGFGGTAFKKVYFCPLRMRPVSETVDSVDLIVNNTATDLGNAMRVTHKTMLPPSTVRRLQILGVYRDISLSTPNSPDANSVDRERAAQQGVALDSPNPDDREREIYECYCELDIPTHEHKFKGTASGLKVPYVVTIDVTSREILAISRNYREPKSDSVLPIARKRFVKYTYVPGLGFYDIGLLHILGNTTNALTAAVREMLDNGMFANFPGFLQSKASTRQNTNLMRVPPGGAVQIDTQGMDIRQAIMPLPYNTQQMAPLMALAQYLAGEGQRLGGTSELQVGEGRPDAPVGTTLAMIEQATKIENSVHKRAHASQAEEFKLLVECFREHPDAFIDMDCPSGHPWDEAMFLKALDDCALVPQADPNTASHSQRVMKIMALKQLQAANPHMYNPIAIDTAALTAIGWSNPQQFFVPPSAMGQPPPELQQAMAKIANDKTEADAEMLTAQAKAKEVDARIAGGDFSVQPGAGVGARQQTDTPVDIEDAKTRAFDAQTKRQALGIQLHETQLEDQNRDADREARTHDAYLEIAKEVLANKTHLKAVAMKAKTVEKDVGA